MMWGLILVLAVCCLESVTGQYYYAKIPTFMHTCRFEGGLTDADFEKYDFGSHKVTIVEKGENIRPIAEHAEKNQVDACRRLKEKYGTDFKCMIYYNALLSWGYYDLAREYARLVAFEKKAGVNSYRTSGDRTFPGWKNIQVFDFTSDMVTEFFLDRVTCLLNKHKDHVDGIFLDRTYIGPREARAVKGGRKLVASNFETYTTKKNELINTMVAEGVTIVANPGTYYYDDNSSPEDYLFQNLLQDVQYIELEYFCVEYDSIYKLNQAVKSGKGVLAHGGMVQCPGSYTCHKDVRMYLAAFLMGLEDHTLPANAGFGESLFACHQYWYLDIDEAKNNEYIGFKEYELNLGKPGNRVSSLNVNQVVQLPFPTEGGNSFNAYRPFRNPSNNALQAVAVWTSSLKTVCFVQDCTVNTNPANGKYCLGNHPNCNAILSQF